MPQDERLISMLPLSVVGPGRQDSLPASSGVRATALEAGLLAALVEATPSPVIMLDEQLVIVLFNAAGRALLGLSKGDDSALGHSFSRYCAPTQLLAARASLEADTPRNPRAAFQLSSQSKTIVARFQSGELEREVSIGLRSLFVHQRSYLGLFVDDRTDDDREQAERQENLPRGVLTHLERAHHLEALGRLSGALAHDFNNLLSVILGSLQAAKKRLDQKRDPGKDLERAHLAAERSAQSVAQILRYSREQRADTGRVQPALVVRELRELMNRAVGPGVVLSIHLSETPAVAMGAAQLETALLNLVVNACDAIDGEGTVDILLDTCEIPAPRALDLGVLPGDYVSITVQDNGRGMGDAVQARVFEPFFTTKQAGAGTGLGLSSVRSLLRRSGGAVVLESAVGKGTRVQMLFPAVEIGLP